jgi:CRP-like cAMP-binding protein
MERHGRIDEHLAEMELFRGLGSRKLRAITSLTTPLELEPGAVITREGRAGSQFIIVHEGSVAVSACGRVIATRGPGDFLGEISLLGARMQTATALATTPVLTSVVSKPDFWSMLGEAPSVADVLRATMAERLTDVHAFCEEPSRSSEPATVVAQHA